MFTTKSLVAIFAIAAGGFLQSGGPSTGAPSAAAPSQASGLLVEPSLPSHDALQRAAETALLAQIRADLQANEARIQLGELSFKRASGRTLEGRGHGSLSFDAGVAIPIEVSISYDLSEARMEQASYLVSGPLDSAPGDLVGTALRKRIADRIGSRLVLEFAHQPVDFSLLGISHLASGRNRLMVSGSGVTRFPGEGAAFTRFVATADKMSGRIISLQYELLQEISPGDGVPVASSPE